jgi:hypothetical protein
MGEPYGRGYQPSGAPGGAAAEPREFLFHAQLFGGPEGVLGGRLSEFCFKTDDAVYKGQLPFEGGEVSARGKISLGRNPSCLALVVHVAIDPLVVRRTLL